MIQRIQSLFLIELLFLGIALLFVPCQTLITNSGSINIYLLPQTVIQTTTAHLFAEIINIIGLITAIFTLFLFKKRELQIKLSYFLIMLWLVLMTMMLFCPFVIKNEDIITVNLNYFVVAIGVFALIAIVMAIRFIKKDIALLKSADRIR